jgi:hypothetical protein
MDGGEQLGRRLSFLDSGATEEEEEEEEEEDEEEERPYTEQTSAPHQSLPPNSQTVPHVLLVGG